MGYLSAVAYVSADGLPYEIDAPSTLMANMTSRGDVRGLHMVNWTGCKHESPQQNVYYMRPIENVAARYKVPPGRRVTGVKMFVPEGLFASCGREYAVRGASRGRHVPRRNHRIAAEACSLIAEPRAPGQNVIK